MNFISHDLFIHCDFFKNPQTQQIFLKRILTMNLKMCMKKEPRINE